MLRCMRTIPSIVRPGKCEDISDEEVDAYFSIIVQHQDQNSTLIILQLKPSPSLVPTRRAVAATPDSLVAVPDSPVAVPD